MWGETRGRDILTLKARIRLSILSFLYITPHNSNIMRRSPAPLHPRARPSTPQMWGRCDTCPVATSPRRAPLPLCPTVGHYRRVAATTPPRSACRTAATLRPQKKRTVNAMSTQPKDTYGLNLVPATRAHVAQRLCMSGLPGARRTYDGSLVDETEEPAHGGRHPR